MIARDLPVFLGEFAESVSLLLELAGELVHDSPVLILSAHRGVFHLLSQLRDAMLQMSGGQILQCHNNMREELGNGNPVTQTRTATSSCGSVRLILLWVAFVHCINVL